MRDVVTRFIKRGTLTFTSLVLALSTLAPLVSALDAHAEATPLSAAVSCQNDKAVLTLTTRQAELPGVPQNAQNWSAKVTYTTPYGLAIHNLNTSDVDTYTVATGAGKINSHSISADVLGSYTTHENITLFGHVIGSWDEPHAYSKHLTAAYAGVDCRVPSTPLNLHMLDNTHNNYAPLAAGVVSKDVDPAQADLVWDAPAEGTVNHYIVTTYKDGVQVGQGWVGSTNSWVGHTDGGFGLRGDGAYTFSVVAYNAAGEASVAATSDAYIYDGNGPTVEINGAAPKSTYKLTDSINVHVSDDNLDHTDIDRIDSDAPSNDKHWVYAGEYFGLSWLKDGTYTITAYDKAGNTTSYTFTTDRTKPHVTGSTEPSVNPTSFTITATDDSADGGHSSGIARVTGNIYKYDPTNAHAGSDGYYLYDSNSSTDNPFTVDGLDQLPDGIYYVKYNAQDGVGNISNTEEFNFTVDNTAPVLTITGVVRNSDGTYTVSGTTDDDSDVTVTAGTTSMTTTPVAGAWQVTFALADGPYEVTAESTDAANNTGFATPFDFTATTPVQPGGNTDNSDTGDGTKKDDSGDDTSVANLIFNPNAARLYATTQTANNDESILGTQDEKSNSGDQAVKGASDVKKDNGSWNILGLAWYWWLLIIVVLALIARWLVGRFRQSENA